MKKYISLTGNERNENWIPFFLQIANVQNVILFPKTVKSISHLFSTYLLGIVKSAVRLIFKDINLF